MSLAVLCVGRVYCDLVFSGLQTPPKAGAEVYADGLTLHTGGGAAITAAHLAQLQQPVELCANLPASPFSHIVHDELDGSVGLKLCAVETKEDPQITAVLTGAMDRSFVTRRVGQALPVNYEKILSSDRQLTESIAHMHIGELATLLEHPDLIAIARSANWSISLDCAWDTDAMQSADAKQLIESVDMFMPNEAELAQLGGIGISANSAPLTILKKGEAGAEAYWDKQSVNLPAVHAACIDSTGAGDAFNAGFIHAWLQKRLIEECLDAGNRCGAIAVAQVGGIPKRP